MTDEEILRMVKSGEYGLMKIEYPDNAFNSVVAETASGTLGMNLCASITFALTGEAFFWQEKSKNRKQGFFHFKRDREDDINVFKKPHIEYANDFIKKHLITKAEDFL